jgi:hypothetical protein
MTIFVNGLQVRTHRCGCNFDSRLLIYAVLTTEVIQHWVRWEIVVEVSFYGYGRKQLWFISSFKIWSPEESEENHKKNAVRADNKPAKAQTTYPMNTTHCNNLNQLSRNVHFSTICHSRPAGQLVMWRGHSCLWLHISALHIFSEDTKSRFEANTFWIQVNKLWPVSQVQHLP